MKVIAALLLLCTVSQANAQLGALAKNDLERQKLKGNVTVLTEYEYAVATGGRSAEKGALKVKSVWTYNVKGNCSQFETFSPDGKLMSQSVFIHADTGTEVKRFRGDLTLNVTTKYKYDKAGNESEESNYDPTGTLFMTAKSKYDLNGNRIVYDRYDMFGHLFLRSNVKFDKKGNEIQEREFDSHESLQYTTTYRYEGYDKQGNWLKRVMLKNDEPRTITEREITY